MSFAFQLARHLYLILVDETIKPIIESAFSYDSNILPSLATLVRKLRDSEQKNFLKIYLRFIASKGLNTDGDWQNSNSQATSKVLPALTYLTGKLLEDNKLLKGILVAHLTCASGTVAENDIFTFRVLVSSLCTNMGELAFIYA